MFQRLLDILGLSDQNSDLGEESRRSHTRFPGKAQATVIIDGHRFPIRDWSPGGMLFETGGALEMEEGQVFVFTLEFHLDYDVVTLEHEGRVVRTQKRAIAAQFKPLTIDEARLVNRAIDAFNAQSFSESQFAT